MATKTKKAKSKGKRTGVCLVTGNPTSGGNFQPGMDARLKGMLIRVTRGEQTLSSVPKAALAKLRENGSDGLVGFRLSGDKLTKIGNFNIAEKGSKKAKSKKELNSKRAFAKGSKKERLARRLAKQRKAAVAASTQDEGSEEE